MNRACSVEVSGLYMAATDILLDAGGSATCGSIVPQEATGGIVSGWKCWIGLWAYNGTSIIMR